MTETNLQLGGGYTYQWECAILLALNYFFEPVCYNPTLFDLANDFLGQVAEIYLEEEDQESGGDLEDIILANGDRRILIQVKAKQAEGERWTPTDPLLHKALYRFYNSRFFTQQPHNARFVFLSNRPFNPALVQVQSAIRDGTLDQCTEAEKLHKYLAHYATHKIDISRFRKMLARTALVEYLGVDEIKANIQAKLQGYGRRDWEQAHTVLFEHFARQSTRVGGGTITRVLLDQVLGLHKTETRALVAGRLRLVGEPGYGPFLVPFHHNPDFVGREEDLVRLHEMVYQGDLPVGIRPTVLVGLGGIGKTQLAVEYTHAHRDDYPGGVFWLNAVNPLLHELADLAEALGLADKETPRDQAARRAWAYLDARPDALVVFDDVVEPANLNAPFAPGLIPANLRCRTLFTTRQRDLPRNFRPFEVKVLPEMAAMQLLLRARPEVLDEHHPQWCVACLVCASLGWLPLALELAAAYLGKYPVTLDGYLERLRTEGKLATVDDTDLRPEDLPTRHVAAVEATLRTHWSRLDKEKDNDARLIFRAAGRLPEGAWIPVAWLGLLSSIESEARPGRPAPLTRALIRLQEVSLILEMADDRLRLHPLVHDFAAKLTPKDERKACVVELASNTVNSLKDPTRRNKWALIIGECLLALGWNDLSTEIHKPVLNALLELVHGNGVHERQRWTAASLLTRMGWLSDLKDVPASNVQDTTLEEFLAYLDIFDNFIFGKGECDAVVQIIDRILGTMSSESVGVKQAQMLVYRAIMNGKMGERLGSIDLLDASTRDYQKVGDALDRLAEEGQSDMQKTLAQARLGAANVAMVRAEHLKDPKAVQEQRQEAVRLYKEANESALACGDQLLQVSIFGELSHALALLREWKDAEQAYSNALEILDELEAENPNAYANDRAWVFVTAGDTHLRKGLTLNDQVEFGKGYTKAEEAIELLQHIALGKFDISLLDAHITAADCAWAESKRHKGAPASSARARAEAHWKSAHEIARQLGEEGIVAEQSIFYNRR